MRTLFIPIVSEYQDPGSFALRTVRGDLESAKADLSAEVARAGKPPLVWVDEFGGARAQQGPLVYEVRRELAKLDTITPYP